MGGGGESWPCIEHPLRRLHVPGSLVGWGRGLRVCPNQGILVGWLELEEVRGWDPEHIHCGCLGEMAKTGADVGWSCPGVCSVRAAQVGSWSRHGWGTVLGCAAPRQPWRDSFTACRQVGLRMCHAGAALAGWVQVGRPGTHGARATLWGWLELL